jgi:hypothetical protein
MTRHDGASHQSDRRGQLLHLRANHTERQGSRQPRIVFDPCTPRSRVLTCQAYRAATIRSGFLNFGMRDLRALPDHEEPCPAKRQGDRRGYLLAAEDQFKEMRYPIPPGTLPRLPRPRWRLACGA